MHCSKIEKISPQQGVGGKLLWTISIIHYYVFFSDSEMHPNMKIVMRIINGTGNCIKLAESTKLVLKAAAVQPEQPTPKM